MSITVAVVEDNPNLLAGTSYILRASPSYKVVGEYPHAEGLLDEVDDCKPDVVLMDIGLPGMSGIAATAELKRRYPHMQIIILSVFEDDENVFQAICAGACGYIAKPVMPAELLEAVEQAFGGSSPMSPKIARKVLELFRRHMPPPRADYNLTERELEVLDLLTQGADHKQIAEKLFLSPYTIRAHLRNIYDKLHVHSKSQAVAKALQERLLPRK
ncbi:response regulator transcription factor [bacterium]|nr:MAG: DNA-binding response regulator [candidate division KSB1 bacterium]MCE7940123.1 DNA-binding response regulator [Chlorobi bacterium CHB1]MCL4705819.1 response regulator transcription factor [bacterium]MDL1873579.1 response regulator transcription factor [Cytophagia bacterium CHB2]MBC6946999.1 DNA-binding response regulator [candidate division KSB1 bacterium]